MRNNPLNIRKPSPMLIATKSGSDENTGRYWNYLDPKKVDNISIIFDYERIIDNLIADKLAKMLKDQVAGTQFRTLDKLKLVYLRLALEPKRHLEWGAKYSGAKALKNIRKFLEKEGVIEVYQGRPGDRKGRPAAKTAIRLKSGFDKDLFLNKD